MSQDKILKNKDKLTDNEIIAFKEWQDSEQEELSAPLNAKFYSLFLNGNSCEDIVRLHGGLVTLGQVVHARLMSEWDYRKEQYLEDLFKKIEKRHKQVALETIDFIGNLLSVNTARYNKRLQRYYLNEREEDLGDLAISLKQVKEMAELHQKLSGLAAPKQQIVTGEVTHIHKTEQIEEEETPLGSEEAGEELHKLLDIGR